MPIFIEKKPNYSFWATPLKHKILIINNLQTGRIWRCKSSFFMDKTLININQQIGEL